MGDFNWSSWLPFITVIFVALSVAVTVMGLRTGHYAKGKLTRRGQWMVGTIVSLGVVSLVSTIANEQIATTKEAREARLRMEQFDSQMRGLEDVVDRIDTVDDSLRSSIDRQEQLYGVADRNLQMSTALQELSQANTNVLLRRLFEEGNRVYGDRIVLVIAYICPPQYKDWDPGVALIRATLTVRSPPGLQTILITERVQETLDGGVFQSFLGDLGPFERFEAWRGATMSIHLEGEQRGLGVPLDVAIRNPNPPRRPPSCPVSASLLVNGRQVGLASSILDRSEYRHSAKFENVAVQDARLPKFEAQ